eukprot:TRINITY_DN1433_c0_g1_i1.p1 TRINITY_DN1433_c0_g1~~TRINITY_DN1433_c0_g1_i1.p1  ORF type:complete len:460 (+),score=93.45 TRINITY_DN1433_c0_g1_i1:240-1619(+)
MSSHRGLSREEVEAITPDKVHDTLSRVMLVDGYDMIFDPSKSNGIYLHDSRSGKQFLDMFTFFGSWPVSHNHKMLHDPVFQEELLKVATTNPSNSDIYTVEMAKFVATFERVAMPAEMKHVFFISGGTLAVENALKCAFDWKVRHNFAKGITEERGHRVMHFKEAFHGRSGYCLSLTNTHDPNKYKYFPKFHDWPRMHNPKARFPLTEAEVKRVEIEEKNTLGEIEHILKKDGIDIACIILEPMQAEGGDNHFRKEFFVGLRRLADKYDVLLIFDEVQTGGGLAGHMWSYQHPAVGITPDLVCFGKKMQICGFMSTDRVNSVADNVFKVSSRINSTWGGSLVDMVRSRRLLEIVEHDKLIENAAKMGEYLVHKIEELDKNVPGMITNIRALGLLCAFDLPSHEIRNKYLNLAYSHGLMLIGCGAKSIRCRPNLSINEDEINIVLAKMQECLKIIAEEKN